MDLSPETQGRDVKRVLERYAAFTHNAQYLYNHLAQFPLPMTPSLTVQWLGGPDSAGIEAREQHVMYGSQNTIIPVPDEAGKVGMRVIPTGYVFSTFPKDTEGFPDPFTLALSS